MASSSRSRSAASATATKPPRSKATRALEAAAKPPVESRKNELAAQLKNLRKLKPRTPNQALFLQELLDPKKTIVIGAGLAGTGKTFLSISAALTLLADPLTPYQQLYIFKSVKMLEGEDMGFLPGDVRDKLQYLYQSFFLQFEKLIDPATLTKLLDPTTGCIKVLPLGCIRGISLSSDTIALVDECQNLSVENTHTLLTRFEEGAKLICLGDEAQVDRPGGRKTDNGLTYLLGRIAGLSPEIAVVRFGEADCVRKKLIRQLQRAFDEYQMGVPGGR